MWNTRGVLVENSVDNIVKEGKSILGLFQSQIEELIQLHLS